MEASASRKRWAVYVIKQREGMEKAVFVRVGIAFLNRDGSYNLHLDATPLDGKLHMREWREDATTEAGEGDAPPVIAEPKRGRGSKAPSQSEAAF